MTLNDLIPGRRDRKHSPDTVIRRLREDIAKLLNWQAGADRFFDQLMHDVVTTNQALEWTEERRQDAEEKAAAMQSERDEWRDEALALRARFGPQIAAEANAQRVDVPPMVRDTAAMEDQATAPIDVKPLWEALDVHYAGPGAASPTHVPAWAVADEGVA